MKIYAGFYCISLYTVLFLNERDKLWFQQTGFLSTVFLCSEFKLENICSGVNFLREKCFR